MRILLSMLRQTTKRRVSQAKKCVWISTSFASMLFTLAFVLTPDSFGQGTTGSINGNVIDPSGAAVFGATVTVRQVDTNSVHTVTTSDVGSYTVTQLAPGTYSVRVDKSGFEAFQRNDLILEMDQVAKVDAKLSVGSEQQTVNVSSETPIIQTRPHRSVLWSTAKPFKHFIEWPLERSSACYRLPREYRGYQQQRNLRSGRCGQQRRRQQLPRRGPRIPPE